MTNIAIPIAPALQKFRIHIRDFIAGMVFKLNKNSHKETPDRLHIDSIIQLLREEIYEFEEQLKNDKFDENSLLELFDIANYAFLAFVALRNDGVETYREKWINEYLDIDTENGKVFCKKTRPGSQYKVGEEIKGYKNKDGYVIIKLQKFKDKFSNSLPRSHIIWWKATGQWPVGVVDHWNRIRDDDSISNLRDATFSENVLNSARLDNRKYPPNVTIYMPSGREHLTHYGKFVYQRHFNGVNIRVAYFDTPEEAAKKGYELWLIKTGQQV